MCAEGKGNIRLIGEAEAGIKLLRFLERGLGLPRPLLFRLLRTGQVRVNKGRAKPERLLRAGDEVRLPPNLAWPEPAGPGWSDAGARPPGLAELVNLVDLGPRLRIIRAGKHWLALDKGPGLPVQPGSAHEDSVSARLRQVRAQLAGAACFTPAPAHRLDKQSSGLLLAGRTPLGQRWLSALFAGDKRELSRIYLVWVSGAWLNGEAETLRDRLIQKRGPDGLERMYTAAGAGENGAAKEAAAVYRPLGFLESSPCGPASLLEVRLLTGRKHQIRVQCAERGHPVIGDRRYGGPVFRQLLLHAAKISLPAEEDYYGETFAAVSLGLAPDWPAPFQYEMDWRGHSQTPAFSL